MQDAYAPGWSGESHLSAETLGSLHELNHRFLGLNLGPAERALSPEQRLALARCPYALFDLRFHDDAHWLPRLQAAPGWRVADQAAADGECAEFARLALFFAWHLASTTALAAQLVLGMNAAHGGCPAAHDRRPPAGACGGGGGASGAPLVPLRRILEHANAGGCAPGRRAAAACAAVRAAARRRGPAAVSRRQHAGCGRSLREV